MNYIECNIALIPDKILSKKMIESSETLNRFGGLFNLGINQNFPHLSLYVIKINNNKLSEVINIVSNIANNYMAFN